MQILNIDIIDIFNPAPIQLFFLPLPFFLSLFFLRIYSIRILYHFIT